MSQEKTFKYNRKLIRNFSIIAHIDHGKSTLADRLLEITDTIPKREMQAQVLDAMDLERERGITIKAHPVTMLSIRQRMETLTRSTSSTRLVMSTFLVRFHVRRCLRGALWLSMRARVQAQTLANVHLAVDRGLTIVPVINKIDLPAADVEV
jgi:GTP-binding protein LepA